MKKNEETNAQPRKRGRPAGSTKPTPGLLHIAPADLIALMNKTTWATTDDKKAEAVIKVPSAQKGGANGKTINTRIYCPNAWNMRPVLSILLSDQQAAALKKADLLTQAADIIIDGADDPKSKKN